jgi:uncharacterized protein YbcI
MNEAAAPTESTDSHPSVLAEISRHMVRLYKEQFGRGPTKARTHFAGPDTVICTLEDSLTPAERRLAEMNEHQRLRDTRLYFQHATENEFRGVIESALDRKVRGFVSGIDTRSDISAEVFYLEPTEPRHIAADKDGLSASQPSSPVAPSDAAASGLDSGEPRWRR